VAGISDVAGADRKALYRAGVFPRFLRTGLAGRPMHFKPGITPGAGDIKAGEMLLPEAPFRIGDGNAVVVVAKSPDIGL